MATETECSICTEKFTKEKRKSYKCIGCGTNACRECIRKYLIGENMVDDPHCMGCRVAWNQSVLLEAVGASFLNKDIARHRGNILLNRHRATIPQVLEYATARKDIIKHDTEISNEYGKLATWYTRKRQELENRLKPKREELTRLRRIVNGNQDPRSRAKFVHKCTHEECEGFLSSQWKCGVCETFTCSECGVNIGKADERENHQCNPNNVASFKLVRDTCKPCPSCGTQIHKIEGCDQMWCTQCQTPFSWRTGQKISGTVHNPHYVEWARRRGNLERQPRPNVCGGDDDVFTVIHSVHYAFDMPLREQRIANRHHWLSEINPIAHTFSHLFQRRQHYVAHEQVLLQPNTHVDRNMLADFITRDISEGEYVARLIITDKRNRFNTELRQIYETFAEVVLSQLRRVSDARVNSGNFREDVIKDQIRCLCLKVICEMIEFFNYLKEQIENALRTYKYSSNVLCTELTSLPVRLSWAVAASQINKPDSWDESWPPSRLVPVPPTYIPANYAVRRQRYY